MNRFGATLTVICLAAALSGTAAAATDPATPPNAPMHRGWHDGPGGDMHPVLDQLNLTADQKTQVQSIFAQAKPRMQALRDKGRANHEQLISTPPTDPAYPGLIASAKSNASELIQLGSDLWTQIYATLTPEQRAKIPGIVADQKAKREAHRAEWQQQHPGQ